jgi:prophage antirepressor-like protein
MCNVPVLIPCGNHTVRTINLDGITLFVAKDICNILGSAKANKILGRYCESIPGYMRMMTPGGLQYIRVIDQDDIEAILSHSQSPAVPLLRRWLNSGGVSQRNILQSLWNLMQQLIWKGKVK